MDLEASRADRTATAVTAGEGDANLINKKHKQLAYLIGDAVLRVDNFVENYVSYLLVAFVWL